MDLLCVPLHELGHALGEEHSEHASDYMATSLQPGQRKLPSAEETEHLLALSTALHPSKQPLPPAPQGFTAITYIASVEPLVSTKPATSPGEPTTPWGGFGGLVGWLATRRRSNTATM